MRRLFLQDLKRSFCNMGFFVGLGFLFALLMPPLFLDSPLNGSRSYLNTLGNVFHDSAFSPFAAMFPGMAYAAAFCEEYQSGYLRMIVARAGVSRYTKVRVTTVALSGGVMMAFSIGVVCAVAYATGIHGVPSGTDEGLLGGSRIISYIETYGDWFVLWGKVILGFLAGALWALVGLAFAVWIPNRHVALLMPFILYDGLWLLLNRIWWKSFNLVWWASCNPVTLVNGDNVDHGNYPLAAAVQLLNIAAAVWVIHRGMRRAVNG